jgi:hypothetical protein
MSYEYIYNGAGVGVGDLNNDGLGYSFAGTRFLPHLPIGQF